MLISCFENNFLKSNSYLIEIDNILVAIDPSYDELFIETIIKSKNALKYIFLTHEHIDHITGIVKLKKLFKDVLIVATEFTSTAILDPKKNLSVFHGFEFVGEFVDKQISNVDSVKLNENIVIDLYPCKGHSLGGMFISFSNIVFCGDEFIFELKTVTKMPGGSKSELIKSYNFLHSKFDNKTILYPGHGNFFLLEELKIW